MIAKIDGALDSLDGDKGLVRLPGGLTFEVLLPAYTAARLSASVGRPVSLHTLSFLESQNQGATILPRLAGFGSAQDKAFYELFVTCKGIGHRRALRAMTIGPGRIAAAIADRDLSLLQSLPEIGRRTAETIVASLRGKVDRFVSTDAYPDQADPRSERVPSGLARESLEVLLQLGEKRTEAVTLIDQVLSADDAPGDVQTVVAEVYRARALAR